MIENIVNSDDPKEMFDQYGVDGIMIGRAAIGQPWIFRDIKHYLETNEKLPPPGLSEKIRLARIHFQKSLEWKGEPRGIFEMRRHMIHYFKGLPDFRETRLRLVTSTDVKEIEGILDYIEQKYASID